MAHELDARRTFYVACLEVFRDGVVEPFENKVLKSLLEALKLSPEEGRALAARASTECKQKGYQPGSLDPARAIELCKRVAAADGTVTEEERELLLALSASLEAEPEPEPEPEPEVLHIDESQEQDVGSFGEVQATPMPTRDDPPEKSADQGGGVGHGVEPEVGDAVLDLPFVGPISLIQLLSTLGAMLIGVGVLFLIAANWQVFPPWSKFVMLDILVLVAYGIGYEVCLRPQRAPGAGRALILLGTFFFGGGIWLVGQTFHQGAHYPDGFLVWALGIVPLGYAMTSATIVGLAMILLIAWSAFEQVRPHEALPWLPALLPGTFRTLNLAFVPIFLSVAIPAIQMFPAPSLVPLTIMGMVLWALVPISTLGIDAWLTLVHTAVPGLVLALALSRLLRAEEEEPTWARRQLEWTCSRTLLLYGAVLALTPAEHVFSASLARISGKGEGLCFLPVTVSLLAVVASVMDWQRRTKLREKILSRTLAMASLAVAAPAFLAGVGASQTAIHVSFQVVCVGITFGAVYTSLLIRDQGLLWSGLLPLFGWVGWTMLSWIGSLGSTGLSLIAGGIVILAGAFSLERLRQQVKGWDGMEDTPAPPPEAEVEGGAEE